MTAAVMQKVRLCVYVSVPHFSFLGCIAVVNRGFGFMQVDAVMLALSNMRSDIDRLQTATAVHSKQKIPLQSLHAPPSPSVSALLYFFSVCVYGCTHCTALVIMDAPTVESLLRTLTDEQTQRRGLQELCARHAELIAQQQRVTDTLLRRVHELQRHVVVLESERMHALRAAHRRRAPR